MLFLVKSDFFLKCLKKRLAISLTLTKSEKSKLSFKAALDWAGIAE